METRKYKRFRRTSTLKLQGVKHFKQAQNPKTLTVCVCVGGVLGWGRFCPGKSTMVQPLFWNLWRLGLNLKLLCHLAGAELIPVKGTWDQGMRPVEVAWPSSDLGSGVREVDV